ncbi:protein containing DUF889, eukaryote, partial [mine drainage metagenome]
MGQLLSGQAILAPTNNLVDEINLIVLGKMGGAERCYMSKDSISRDGALHQQYALEQLQAYNPPGYPPSALRLKPGSIVMLLRNVSISTGLTNGTRLIVEELHDNIIKCKRIKPVLGFDDIVYIPRISFTLKSKDTGLECDIKRVQFPL